MSGASTVDIYNLALSYLDLSVRVESLTEKTPQAGYCNQFYDRARKSVLEQCYWSFATVASALPLLLDQQTLSPDQIRYPGWRYIYSRPAGLLKAQAVTTTLGLRSNPHLGYWWGAQGYWTGNWGRFRPPWAEMLDQVTQPVGNAIDIVTDVDSAWLVYTVDAPNVAIWPETMIDTVAWHLSHLISGPASANQKAKEMALKMAPLSLSRALAQNLNEQQDDAYPESPSIQARF